MSNIAIATMEKEKFDNALKFLGAPILFTPALSDIIRVFSRHMGYTKFHTLVRSMRDEQKVQKNKY